MSLALLLAFGSTACVQENETPRPGAPGRPGTPAPSLRAVDRTDIVSDQADAVTTDPLLVNAWGLAFNPIGAAWISATETGVSVVYDANGQELIPAVVIPGSELATTPGSPTGQVYNPYETAFLGDELIFVTEGGTISGWHESGGALARLRVDASAAGANYKGVTIVNTGNVDPRLFAANFAAGTVDVFDASYMPIATSGSFKDPSIPPEFSPFNVQNIDGNVAVAYALPDEEGDDVPGPGNGYVDLFDTDGNLISQLLSGGELDSPWGMTMTPSDFGDMPGRLLVGNFGDGMIHVYRLDTGSQPPTALLEGTLDDRDGNPIVIDGLWALELGVDVGGFSSKTLYFTAGPDDESHGLFGRLEAVATGAASGEQPSTPYTPPAPSSPSPGY